MLKSLWQSWKGFRTVIVNGLATVGAVILWIGPDLINFLLSTDLSPIIPDEYAPGLIVGLSVLNIFLRKITTTPIFRREGH